MTERYDAIVIGAGHNGLVCAGYLARAGMRVVLCEASTAVGGMAAGRRFGDGERYGVPGLAHLHCPVGKTLCNDLKLDDFGYSVGEPIDTIALAPDAAPLVLGVDSVKGDALNDADIAAYPQFRRRYAGFAAALAPLFETKPPRLKNLATGDLSTLTKLGWKIRFGLGRDIMYEFLRVAAINIHDVLNEAFDDERLKAAIALDAVLGSAMGPRTPGTVLTWLQRLHGERHGAIAMSNGTLVAALAQSAEAAGVTIRPGCPVERVLIDEDRATGVMLAGGETLEAGIVVSGIDPRATFLQLVGAPQLDTMFANRVRQIRGAGVVGKLHLGLEGLPEFSGVDASQLRQRLLIAPTMRHVERAFNCSKYGECAEHPVFEITVPSLADPSLAPEGRHVMSVNVAYLPFDVKGGWQENKAAIVRHILAELATYAPGIESQVSDHEFLSPADIEREYGAVQGHWHHGELSIHQSFMLRPLYGAAQYDTPVEQLYLCSAGCHPGGGVAGLAGRNAAKRILESGAAS
jgi:phytoene dehydrogenase-like protein